ncbi:C-C motif chemokine 25 [Oryzias melastigma]|uniref:C-C motif chemokine 25 n=1 Tax=Oryzias melastigma TaxID=30732 RepID=A0A834FK12_ORYME|nr:C-C motif chemokine 25 [Oryzias melastigma]
MTNSKVCLAAALCSLLFLSTLLSSAQSASCCLSYSRRRPPCKLILGYSIQTITGSCDLHAVIFHLPGKFLCADPSMKWTQKLRLCVEERKRTSAQVFKLSAD